LIFLSDKLLVEFMLLTRASNSYASCLDFLYILNCIIDVICNEMPRFYLSEKKVIINTKNNKFIRVI